MNDGGDLGRRVTARREELRLTIDDVATRAGIAPEYLSNLESRPTASVGRGTLWRLAGALETTPQALSGGNRDMPPGHDGLDGTTELTTLDRRECLQLLGPGGIGRVIVPDGGAYGAFPVNFCLIGEDVVYRTFPTAAPARATEETAAAFEADRIDEVRSEGWSVLVRGKARTVTDADEKERAETMIVSWAPGDRDFYIMIAGDDITGRRITRGDAIG